MNVGCGSRVLTWRNAAARVLACVLFVGGTAHAGHAPIVPEPRTILLREGHPEHVVIGTRRGGYFVTQDAGSTWSWMCEAGVGYDEEEVYPGALLKNGTIVVSTGFGGLSVSPDGCGWSPWLPSEQPFVADVRVRPGEVEAVVALEARSDGNAFVNQLWQSIDDAKTWQPLGQPLAPDTQAVSLAVASDELFVATAGPAGAELLRSTDDAVSWQRTPITPELGATPRLVGALAGSVYAIVDFAQADGITTSGDRALVSRDHGATFTTLLAAAGDLSAWSLSSDGEQLVVGGHTDGIYSLASAAQAPPDASMSRLSTSSVHVLAWGPDGRLYAAGHEASDGFSVGVSDDGGRTFSPLFALCQVTGPLACPADSTVGTLCSSSGETGWGVRKEVASSDACPDTTSVGASNTPTTPPSDPVTSEPVADVSAPSTDATSTDKAAGCAISAPQRRGSFFFLLALAAAAGLRKRAGRDGRRRSRALREQRLRAPSCSTWVACSVRNAGQNR